MRIRRPLGHAELIESLWAAAASGRLPHALFFEGPEGIGKFASATWFAAGLLCTRGPGAPCGTCGPCKRVETDNHADLFCIDPVQEGEERIKVSRIAARGDGEDESRSLESFLDLRALEGENRAVLIRECHRMNDAAQNALLKTLEEPRPGTLLVLESHRPGRLLPTILSRCVRVRFQPLGHAQCEEVLEEAGMEGTERSRYAQLTEGSPGRALLWRQRSALRFLELLVACVTGKRGATTLAADAWEVEADFPGQTTSAEARERARFVLDLALLLLRDAERLAAGVPADQLPLGSEAAAVGAAGWGTVRRAIEAVLECRSDVDRNLAPDSVLERALLVLAERGRIVKAR